MSAALCLPKALRVACTLNSQSLAPLPSSTDLLLGSASSNRLHQLGTNVTHKAGVLPRESRQASTASLATAPSPSILIHPLLIGSPMAAYSLPSLSRVAPNPPSMRSVYRLKEKAASLQLKIPNDIIDSIWKEASKPLTGVSMRHILDFGSQPVAQQMLLSAQFLHQELPVRLAHCILQLNNLPEGLAQTSHVNIVKSWYAESFARIQRFPSVHSDDDVAGFTEMLREAYMQRHEHVVPAIAQGVIEYKALMESSATADHAHLRYTNSNSSVPPFSLCGARGASECNRAQSAFLSSMDEDGSDLKAFLDNLFLSRISTRFLAGQHIALCDQANNKDRSIFDKDHHRLGLIDLECSPITVIKQAVDEARDVCIGTHGYAPEVQLHGDRDLTMAFDPSHLNFMVFELIKNALRATQEQCNRSTGAPPVTVVVTAGDEDVAIKVSDQGGGIPRSELSRVFGYLYTTAHCPLSDKGVDYRSLPTVLAGYGCGLPLSKLRAKYFGGDLQICSMHGYGTDAFLHLCRSGSEEELLHP